MKYIYPCKEKVKTYIDNYRKNAMFYDDNLAYLNFEGYTDEEVLNYMFGTDFLDGIISEKYIPENVTNINSRTDYKHCMGKLLKNYMDKNWDDYVPTVKAVLPLRSTRQVPNSTRSFGQRNRRNRRSRRK